MDFVIVLALGLGLLWLLTSRQRKTQRAAANFRAELGPGDEVMTGSGLFGTVVEVDGDIITLETSPGVTSEWLRAAIAKQASPADHRAPLVDEEESDEDEDYDETDAEYDETDADYDETDEDAETEAPDTEPVAQDWDVEVPDDASSITDDGDEKR